MAIPSYCDDPLGFMIARFDGDDKLMNSLEEVSQRQNRWAQIALDEHLAPRFIATLSNAQTNVHHLLIEWLMHLSKALNTDMNTAIRVSIVLSLEHITIPDLHLESALEIRVMSFCNQIWNDKTAREYHANLSALYRLEFDIFFEQLTRKEQQLLWILRGDAAMLASCHRIAVEWWQWRCGRDDLSHGRTLTSSLKASLDKRPVVCASINPCPWLETHLQSRDLPYYLWDVVLQKTLKVATINGSLSYIAISHTWGRWQMTDDGNVLFAAVPGVPWKVPRNSRFDVESLPVLLQQLSATTRYVWLDLICIPQDRSELASKEIAKQADIFKNASKCIAWMNDIDGWFATQTVITWLCLLYLHVMVGSLCQPAIGPDAELIDRMASLDTIELCMSVTSYEDRPGHLRGTELVANAWFTSLWTLQEMCMRPDIYLCDKSFSILCLYQDGIPISIADIAAFFLALREALYKLGCPGPVQQLQNLVQELQLDCLDRMPRSSIISSGNIRQCTSRRYEAIMSVLGCTDWYLPWIQTGADSSDGELVLGKYPLVFVNECRAKMGSASFFYGATFKTENLRSIFYTDSRPPNLSDLDAVGSLLPFACSPNEGSIINMQDSVFLGDDSSLASWKIDHLGRVHISEVVIDAASDRPRQPFICLVVAPSITAETLNFNAYPMHEENDDSTIRGDLSLWIYYYKPATHNYAVSLCRGRTHSTGVLLKEIVPGVLIRIGYYHEYEPGPNDPEPEELPPYERRRIDWTVI